MRARLIPDDFEVPSSLEHERFRLRKLTVDDVVGDWLAIQRRVAPDGSDDPWLATTLRDNLVDLGWHEKEFDLRRSFAYTVTRAGGDEIIGCVYLDPSTSADVDVRLWVTREAWLEGLDPVIEASVHRWLLETWPFERVARPGRGPVPEGR